MAIRYGVVFWGGIQKVCRIPALQKHYLSYNSKASETCKEKLKQSKSLTVQALLRTCDICSQYKAKRNHNLKNVKCSFSFIQKV